MADETVRAEVDPAEFRALMARIKEFDPALARALRKRLRIIAKDIAGDMQAEVRSAPGGRTPGRHNTRDQIAAGIGVQIASGKKRQGVFVTGSGKAMGAGRKAMPRAFNKSSFRHPVFPGKGKRTKWVSQRGHPYFGPVIARNEGKAEQAVADALSEAIETMEG